jgi:hypothetical protein
MLGRGPILLCVALHIGCAVDPEDDELLDDDWINIDGKGDVYGTDDRKERYQFSTTSITRKVALSSGMVAYKGLLKQQPDGNYALFEPRTLAQTGVCANERFANQPEVGHCSATLIASDLVVTSGHCLMNSWGTLATAQQTCANIRVVFDFAYDTAPTNPLGALRVLPKSDVYDCVQVLDAANPNSGELPKHDYAILKLDRPVTGRTPVPVYGGTGLASGARAIQIGHPSGLPQKIAPAVVREKLDPHRYQAYRYESDILGGNSGGGVFTVNGTLFGVPTRYSGKNYVLDTSVWPDCYRVAVCGVNATCTIPPGAYDTAAMLKRIPSTVKSRLTVKTL